MNFAPLDALIARRRGLTIAFAALAGLVGLAAGQHGIDNRLRDLRDGIRSQPASGEVHVVEIDSRSIKEVAHWPWPRRNHAQLIDRLHEAGARSIAFDVDFSSPSNPADDRALAGALARANGSVILATLRQWGAEGPDTITENLPIAAFRDHAFLGAVNIVGNRDGQVRNMLLGVETGGVPRPALAALLAESNAEIRRKFLIDYAIEPDTIPRHSAIDVISGRVPPSELAGKRIIIGATALELGDRYAVPRHGFIPGVVIQALAAETLMRGAVPRVGSGFWPLLLALGTIVLAVGMRRVRTSQILVGGTVLVLLLPLATEQWLHLSFPLMPALAALLTAGLALIAFYAAIIYRRRSFVDEATGLPNAVALEAEVGPDQMLVVARIDRFAAIASAIGASATTKLVLRLADRLAFGSDTAVYRLDDSHLAWICPEVAPIEIEGHLKGLLRLMRTPIDCGRMVDVDLTFGISPTGGQQDARQRAAGAALAAEKAGAERWAWVGAADDGDADWHLSLLGELDTALDEGQVWNAYQPKFDIRSGRVIGAEALVRWDHPARGPIGPDRFIPMVEAHGRAREMTLHVVRKALRDAERWGQAGEALSVAVNISSTLLLDETFAEQLKSEIEDAPIAPELITLEVTESAAMTDTDKAIAALEKWAALGVKVSIDDYGTGQSTLNYLQKLPARELKIDKSFITNLANDSRDAIMVRSTIALAHELGIRVVAEGIEDEVTLDLLRRMDCDVAQGWHIGKPMAADKLLALVQKGRQAAA